MPWLYWLFMNPKQAVLTGIGVLLVAALVGIDMLGSVGVKRRWFRPALFASGFFFVVGTVVFTGEPRTLWLSAPLIGFGLWAHRRIYVCERCGTVHGEMGANDRCSKCGHAKRAPET